MADGSPHARTPLAPALPVTALYRDHATMVRRALRTLGVAPANLDDAVQDVFVVLHRRIDDFDRERSVRNWLWGIARGVASGYRRSDRRRRRLHAEATVAPTHAPNPARALEGSVARHQAASILDDFLGSLDADKCAVFMLAEVEGCTGNEIAQKLGVNVNTVYARLRAARQRFRAAVDRHRVASAPPLFASWLPVVSTTTTWFGKPTLVATAGVVMALFIAPQQTPTQAEVNPPPALAAAPHAEAAEAVVDDPAPRTLAMATLAPTPDVELEDDEVLILDDDPAPASTRAVRRVARRPAVVGSPAVMEAAEAAQPPATFVPPDTTPALAPPPRQPWETRVDAMPAVHHPQMLDVRDDFIDTMQSIARHF